MVPNVLRDIRDGPLCIDPKKNVSSALKPGKKVVICDGGMADERM